MSARRTIPPELISKIVNSVVDHPKVIYSTLDAASLVCRAWVEPAQAARFKYLRIAPDRNLKLHPMQLPRICFIASRTHLARKVRCVAIMGLSGHMVDRNEPNFMALYSPLVDILPWLSVALPAVQDLIFTPTWHKEFHSFIFTHVIPAWPTIKTVHGAVGMPFEVPISQSQASLYPAVRALSIQGSDCLTFLPILTALASTAVARSLVDLQLSSTFGRGSPGDLSVYIRTLAQLPNLSKLCLSLIGETQASFEQSTSLTDYSLGSYLFLKYLELAITAAEGASVGFLRCLLAQAQVPALKYLNIDFSCDSYIMYDDGTAEPDDQDFQFFPFRREGEKRSLQGADDGSVLREETWCSMQEVSLTFSSACPVVVHDATRFLGLFGGLHTNPALKINEVKLVG